MQRPFTAVRGATPPPELLVGATVRGLLLSALVEWCWIASAWLAMAFAPGWVYPLWVLLIAGRVHALASLAHDGAHLPPASHPSLGVRAETLAAELLTGWPIGTTWASLRAHHLRHHADTNLGTDPYLRPGLEHAGPLRWFGAWLSLFLIYPHWVLRAFLGAVASFVPALLPVYARLLVVRRRARLPAGSELERCARGDRLLAPALAILFWATWRWPSVLGAYFYLPFLVTLGLNGRRFLAEHHHAPARDRSFAEVMAVTRDTGEGVLARLLLAPRGLGYHRVHHLHPQVGHHLLPALHAWYRANPLDPIEAAEQPSPEATNSSALTLLAALAAPAVAPLASVATASRLPGEVADSVTADSSDSSADVSRRATG